MTNIELIMEVDCSLTEIPFNFTVQCKCCLNNWYNLFLDGSLELGEVFTQESVVDCEQRSLFWEGDGKCPEMSL